MIPLPWKIGAAIVLAGALVAAGATYHHHVYQQGFGAAVSERAMRDSLAVIHRATDNTALAIKQGAINTFIEKATHEELAPVVARIAADRVRVGPAICNGPTATAKAESTSSGDAADTTGRLLRPDLERDIKSLGKH
jgi:hypothetical protein